jgi:guanylate kinase
MCHAYSSSGWLLPATTRKERAKELEDASEYHFHMEMKGIAYGATCVLF